MPRAKPTRPVRTARSRGPAQRRGSEPTRPTGGSGRAGDPAAARRRALVGSAVVTGLGIALLLGFLASRGDLARWTGPEVPLVDVASTQPRVRERIEAAVAGLEGRPDDAGAWGELGMVYHAHDYLEESVVAYARAAELAPADHRWPYLRALALETLRPAEAVAAMDAAIALGADGAAAHWNHGNLLLAAGETDRAREAMDRAVAADPASAHALSGRGRAALASGDAGAVEAAARDLEQAVALDPGWAEAHTLLAQAYRRLGRDAEADPLATLAVALEQQEQIGPADAVFGAVVERGTSSRWLNRRARAAYQAGRLDDAEVLFNDALAADPADPAPLIGLGILRHAKGNAGGAIEFYERALALDADSVEALSNFGLALAQTGDLAGAATRLERAVEIAPGHIEATLNLALIRIDQGRAGDAVALAELLTSAHPNDERVQTTLARALAAAGRVDEADAAWAESLALRPSQPDAWAERAGSLATAGRHAEAVAVLREGLVAVPGDPALSAALAWELATAPEPALRDGASAVDLARSVVGLRPAFADSHDILGAALAEAGDFEGAAAAAEAALQRVPTTGADAIRADITARLDAYRAGRAYRQPR